jgi:hypothetical protein
MKLRERLLRLVVRDRREVRLHITDEDGVRLDAAVLELPLVEGERPERLVDDDAPRPLARVIGTCIGKEVAEQVLEGALQRVPARRRDRAPNAATMSASRCISRLRTRRSGAFSGGVEPLEVGHEADLVERRLR